MALNQACMEPFDGDLELDGTMFGGRRKGKRGWGASGKVIVFGILKRNGQVQVFPIPRRNREEVMQLVRINTRPGSLYFTDDWHAYASLSVRGNHVVVRKSGGAFPWGGIISMVLRGFGAMLSIGCIHCGESLKSYSTSFWVKFHIGSIIGRRTSIH